VEIHTRQKLCHFSRYVGKAKLFRLKSCVPVVRAGVFIWENFIPVTEILDAKPEISVTGPAWLLIWTHRNFYEGKSAEARSRKPSQPGWPGLYEEVLNTLLQGKHNHSPASKIRGIARVTLELFLESFKRTWYTWQSRWPRCTNQERRSWANGFFKLEGFAGKRFLARPTTPCFVDFLLPLQFTRGQTAEKLLKRERLLRRLSALLLSLASIFRIRCNSL